MTTRIGFDADFGADAGEGAGDEDRVLDVDGTFGRLTGLPAASFHTSPV
ncbi:hypothetical protein AB0M43_30775 [Longispora sp. NPDC051575]